jgi:Trk K+ transport system NAD-binding subunit
MFDKIVIAGAGKTVESLLDRLVRLAPVLVLDTAQSALDELRTDAGDTQSPEQHPRHALTRRLGDATSRFVLEEAREDPRLSVALLVATSDDRRNIEICRLARELDFRPIVGIVIEPTTSEQYEAHGARAVVRAQILGSVVEQALRYDGLIIASNVGQGRGEIIEFVVLPSSPAIGVPLSQLSAEGWRIAAIYREGELVIPTGETVIHVEDRVLVIGDPNILPSIAEQLRIGVPQFPLRHGNRVVAYLPTGRTPQVEQEAELLTQKTRADALLRLYPGAEPAKTLYEQPEALDSGRSPRQQHKIFETAPLQGMTLQAHLEELRRLRPGVVVTSSVRRTLMQRIAGRGGRDAALCSALRCPVLFCRGAQRYTRVVHALITGVADMAFADAAIDLSRMLDVPLVVVRVVLPPFLEAPDRHTDQVAVEIERRARAYGITFEALVLEGNPVRELVRLARPDDLFVLPRKRTLRDSFTSPDIALRVAAAARCSTLVKTVPLK